MSGKCDWSCWEIMNCDDSRKCQARLRPDAPCWEIARENSDYRHVMEICVDCIVYVLKGERTVLSKNDLQAIMVHKANCYLTSEECMVTY